jgi:hypothetical protein
VGRDNISDFTANLIKDYLLDYTEKFCKQHVDASLRKTVNVANARFDYERRVWCPKSYELPFIGNDFVLLAPRDILTRDENWINRPDLNHRFEEIAYSIPDEQLRSLVSQYLVDQLREDSTKDDKSKVYGQLLHKYPALIEWYIRWKEDRGDEAVRQSSSKVTDSEERYIHQLGELIQKLELETEFYKHGIDTMEECRARIGFLKAEIENNNGYKLFYNNNNEPIQRESDFQVIFRLVWFASPSDFNSEVNNGRGPVDFSVSRGSKDKTLVEFKLAKNSKLQQNLESQVGVYERANRTDKSLKVIFYFNDSELTKVQRILTELKLAKDDTIYLIDCRRDNKPSASNVKSSH